MNKFDCGLRDCNGSCADDGCNSEAAWGSLEIYLANHPRREVDWTDPFWLKAYLGDAERLHRPPTFEVYIQDCKDALTGGLRWSKDFPTAHATEEEKEEVRRSIKEAHKRWG